DEVVDQQPARPRQRLRGTQLFADEQPALRRAGVVAVRAGEQHAERLVEEPREDVADAQAAARETDDRVEPPSRLPDLERQLLDEPVVLVPRDVQVLHRRSPPRAQWNGWRRRIVSSRSGPVDTMSIGAPATSASRSRYRFALAGSASQSRTPTVLSLQPGISSYTGSQSPTSSAPNGSRSSVRPPLRYAVHSLTVGNPSRTSSLVTTRPEMP